MKTKEEKKIYTVYVIEYKGKIMYVGKTNDFKRRVREHKNNVGKHYSAIPVDVDINYVEILPIETYTTETDALKREDELICEYDTSTIGWNQRRSGLICVSDVKAYQREYRKTDKQKAYHREWMREYRNTEKSKEYQMEYQRQYRLRKKAEKLNAQTV